MKILLVQPSMGYKESLIFPLGLSYLSANLQGHEVNEVSILDLNLYAWPESVLSDKIVEFEPELIGISLRNIDNQDRLKFKYYYKDFQKLLSLIRKKSEYSWIVVGGPGFSMFAQKIMEDNSDIDFGIYLEAEESFPELLNNLHKPEEVKGIYIRQGEKVLFTGARELPDLQKLYFPDRNLPYLTEYKEAYFAFGVQTKRGCSLNCSYCNYPFLSGSRIRTRSPRAVVDEIEELINLTNCNRFFFNDPVFNVPVQHAKKICHEIISRQLSVVWGAYFDIGYAAKDFLHLAAQAGCQDFIFSPDGYSNGALQGLNKNFNQRDIKTLLELFQNDTELKHKHALFGFFINPPGETFLGLIKTVYIYIKIKFCFRKGIISNIGWIRIEPYTEVYDLCKRKNLLSIENELLPQYYNNFERLFYSNPGTCYADPLLKGLFRLVHFAKKIVKRNEI